MNNKLMKIAYINTASKVGGCSMVVSHTKSTIIPEVFNTDPDNICISEFNQTDINKIPPNYFDGFYIDSDITVFINTSQLIKLYKTVICGAKVMFMLHNPILSVMSRKPKLGVELDDISSNHISHLRYISDTTNTTFLVLRESEDIIAKAFGLRHKLYRLDNLVTRNTNDGSIPKHTSPNNNVLFVAAYYNKEKGHLNVLHAIKESELHEFEWYIVGDAFSRSEYKRDLSQFPELFEVLTREDVHLEGYQPDIKKYYQMCYNVLIPSFEAWSFTAVEANSFGCKVVSADYNSLNYPDFDKLVKFNSGNLSYANIGYNIYGALKGYPQSIVNSEDYDIKDGIIKLLASNWNSHIRDFEDNDTYYDQIYSL